MRHLTLFFLALLPLVGASQTIDTLVNVGKYDLHFTIIKGEGTPILFEAGGGNDGTIWKHLTKQIADITGATVITYDRPGLGRSTIDSTRIGIEYDLIGLETALTALGYQGKIMLVSHSLGGFYNTLYSSRHPNDVQAVVFIDANHPSFFTEEHLRKMEASQYYRNMVETVRNNPFPNHIPAIDIVSEKTLFAGTPDDARWKASHRDFVSTSSNRTALMAYETGHYVFLQNRQLVINSIVTLYANQVMPSQKATILERGYSYALLASNDDHRSLMQSWHSENDLNEWGYSFYMKGEMDKAIQIFKLNVMLHPDRANPYDSLGDAYHKVGDTESAIKSYQKALEIDPENNHLKKTLDQLLNLNSTNTRN